MTGPGWVDVPAGSAFPVSHLPYGVFTRAGDHPRCGVRIGDHVLDLSAVSVPHGADFGHGSLNAFLARGPAAWGQAIGLDSILEAIDGIWAERREERYRAAPLLRRAAALGTGLAP